MGAGLQDPKTHAFLIGLHFIGSFFRDVVIAWHSEASDSEPRLGKVVSASKTAVWCGCVQ